MITINIDTTKTYGLNNFQNILLKKKITKHLL